MKRIAFSLMLALAIPAVALAQEKAGQSKDEQEILKTRSEWLEAYYKGDTETLARIETSDFVVISDRTVENRRVYTGMQNAAKAGRWFPKGTTHIDDDIRVRMQGDLAVVSVRGWTKFPSTVSPPQNKTAETEVWVKRDGRWRIMHLHYHQQVQPQQPSIAQPQSAAPAQGQSAFPVSTYAAKDQLGTSWVMEFKRDGTVTVKMDEQSLAPDITYTIKDDQIEISAGTTNAMCSGKGTYKWAFDGKALTFQLVSEPNCQPRQVVLTGNKFIKQ